AGPGGARPPAPALGRARRAASRRAGGSLAQAPSPARLRGRGGRARVPLPHGIRARVAAPREPARARSDGRPRPPRRGGARPLARRPERSTPRARDTARRDRGPVRGRLRPERAARLRARRLRLPHLAPGSRHRGGFERALAVAVDDAASAEIVGGDLDLHPIAREDLDAEAPHLARGVAEHLVPGIELDLEHAIGEGLDDLALHLDLFFLRRHEWKGYRVRGTPPFDSDPTIRAWERSQKASSGASPRRARAVLSRRFGSSATSTAFLRTSSKIPHSGCSPTMGKSSASSR